MTGPRVRLALTALVMIVTPVMIVACVTPVTTARAAEPEVRTYIVQPGDSAWSVAEEFYGSGDKYPIIYKYNGFAGRPPFLLTPGQVLRLPVLGKGPEAQLEWLKRDVKAKPPRALDWLTAREQMNLWRLYRVATGDESAAHIVFDDASDLRLRANALLVIYGASATAARTERRDKREVLLEQGTIQGGLARLDEAATPLVVKTPSAAVDILGKLTQIQAEALVSMVSVFDGRAAVSAQGARVDVPEGQGTVVEKGKRPEPPRPLPPVPAWVDGGGKALVAVVDGERGTWEAAWEPVPGAATYRVELAGDPAFERVLYDVEIGAGVTRLRLVDLAPGRYAVRVGTRDGDLLESKPGPGREVEVLSVAATRHLARGDDGVLEAVGFLEIHTRELDELTRASLRVSIDGGPERPGEAPIALLHPGRHTVRLRSDKAAGELDVRILAVTARLSPPTAPLPRGEGEPLHMDVVVEDERGRPALLPGLVVETSDGRTLPLEATGIGAYRARLDPVATDGPLRLAVRARWLGGELATHELAVTPPAPPPAYQGARDPQAMTPHRPGRGLPAALGKPRPESRVAIDGALVDEDPGAGRFGLGLAGELALGDLALGADLLFADVDLAETDGPQARIGDLGLAARWALGGDVVTLAPSLRVQLPIGPRAGARRLGLEPGLHLRVTPGEVVFVDAAVTFVHANDLADSSDSRLGVTAALSFRPAAAVTLSLSGQVATALGGDGFFATVLGLGGHVDLDALRLGLALGLGLGDDARAGLGAIMGRLVVDVGL
ncbi:MAG: FecR domain-containing protein [Deltaproteobacteria bacterium]|nr:FecR domain-containing protein [Deltaproteobacteria bacterium]